MKFLVWRIKEWNGLSIREDLLIFNPFHSNISMYILPNISIHILPNISMHILPTQFSKYTFPIYADEENLFSQLRVTFVGDRFYYSHIL